MATPDLNVIRAFNMYTENTDHYLQIDAMQLPVLEEDGEDWTAGGLDQETFVPLKTKKLEAGLNLKGASTEVLKLFGLGYSERKLFTGYKAFENDETGEVQQAVITLRGRLIKAGIDNLKAKEFSGYEYMIGAITGYQYVVDGAVIHKITRSPPQKIVNGVNVYQRIARAIAAGV